MAKKVQSKVTTSIDLKNASVDFLGFTDNYAWIRFDNGVNLEFSKDTLTEIVEHYHKQIEHKAYVDSILAQLNN